MSGPTCPNVCNRRHAIDPPDDRRDALDDCRINCVEEPLPDTANGLVADDDDGGGDHQSDNRIGPLSAEGHAHSTDQHQQRGRSIGAGVDAVRSQRGRTDAAPDPDPILGHHLVPNRPDNRRCHHNAQVGNLLRVEPPVDGLVTGEGRRSSDECDHRQTGQVLRFAVTVSEPGVGGLRLSRNASQSGTAVSASAGLCKVSPNSATDPLATTTSACTPAAANRSASETATARMPSLLPSRAWSKESLASWEWGTMNPRRTPARPL